MASALMASQTIILQASPYSRRPNFAPVFLYPARNQLLLPQTLSLSRPAVSASANPAVSVCSRDPPTRLSNGPEIKPPAESLLTGSTRTIATLFALALAISRAVAHRVLNLGLHLKGFHGIRRALVYSAGHMFFAAAKSSAEPISTPFAVLAAGMAKWLDIYSGVLMVRVLLSWFPNIPWERQPLSAIRDLCDPYLNLFRNIIPPIFDTLDVSPLLAFAVLGTLGAILNDTRGY